MDRSNAVRIFLFGKLAQLVLLGHIISLFILRSRFKGVVHQIFRRQHIRFIDNDHTVLISLQSQGSCRFLRSQRRCQFGIDLCNRQAVSHGSILVQSDLDTRILLFLTVRNLLQALDLFQHAFHIPTNGKERIQILSLNIDFDSASSKRGHIHSGRRDLHLIFFFLTASKLYDLFTDRITVIFMLFVQKCIERELRLFFSGRSATQRHNTHGSSSRHGADCFYAPDICNLCCQFIDVPINGILIHFLIHCQRNADRIAAHIRDQLQSHFRGSIYGADQERNRKAKRNNFPFQTETK